MLKLYTVFTILLSLCGIRTSTAQLNAPTKRIYASSESNGIWGLGLGAISDAASAIDNSSMTSSTLTIGLALVAGGYEQTLTFSSAVPVNAPVHVKIGTEASLVNVVGYVIVTAFDANGNQVVTTNNINIVGLLNGQNTYEEILSSSTSAITKVRVRLGSTAGIAVNANLYGAYYETTAATGDGVDDAKPFDVLSGTETTSLINAASILSAGLNPYNAVDGDETTAATLYATVNLIAQQQITALYPGLYPVGSYAHVLVQNPGALLSLSVINGPITIQLLNNGTVVQNTATDGWGLIDLQLLGGGANAKGWINVHANAAFNAVKVISNSTAAGVLQAFNVYEFYRDYQPFALPVEFSRDLTVSMNGNVNILTWATSQEINNRGFHIMRSPDRKKWAEVGFVNTQCANGTGNGSSYSYRDESPISSLNYYQLKQEDLDGKFSFGNIVQRDNGAGYAIQLYPNPVIGDLHLSNVEVGIIYNIMNMSGVKVLSGTINTIPAYINTNSLVSGIYILELKDKQGRPLQNCKISKK